MRSRKPWHRVWVTRGGRSRRIRAATIWVPGPGEALQLASSLGIFQPILTSFLPKSKSVWQKARENWLALGGDSGHTVTCGLEPFLARWVSIPWEMGCDHVALLKAPAQGSFPGAELRKGFGLESVSQISAQCGSAGGGWPGGACRCLPL